MNSPFSYTHMHTQEIFGELYEVDDKLMQHIDWLEAHPDTYTRISTQCVMLDGEDSVVDCEMYIVFDFKPQFLSFTHLSSYDESKLDKDSKYRCKVTSDEDFLGPSDLKK